MHCFLISSRCEDPVGCSIRVVRRTGGSLRHLCAYHSGVSFTLGSTTSNKRIPTFVRATGGSFAGTVRSSLGATSTLTTVFALIHRVGATVTDKVDGRKLLTSTSVFSRLANILKLICGHGARALSDSVRRLVGGHDSTHGGGSFGATSRVHSGLGRVNVILRSAPRNMG